MAIIFRFLFALGYIGRLFVLSCFISRISSLSLLFLCFSPTMYIYTAVTNKCVNFTNYAFFWHSYTVGALGR